MNEDEMIEKWMKEIRRDVLISYGLGIASILCSVGAIILRATA